MKNKSIIISTTLLSVMAMISGCQKSESTEISTEYISEASSEAITEATYEHNSSEYSTQAPTETETVKPTPATSEIKQQLLAEIPDSYRQLLPTAAQLPYQVAASGSLLNKHGAFKNNFVNEKAIYLTFSVNMQSQLLDQLAALLEAKNVKASFFVLVNEFLKCRETYTPILQKLAAQGNIIGSHGLNHNYTVNQSNEELMNDIYLSVKLLSAEIGQPITWYRPPYGFISERDLYIATGMGLKVASYSFAANDYELDNQPTKSAHLNTLKAQLGTHSIFYLHVAPCNIEALGDFIDYAHANGYQFLALGEIPGKPVEPTTEASTEATTESSTEHTASPSGTHEG